MASAKFLEEALSTDVDESAVNEIVGSLETQLVTSTTNQMTNNQQNKNNSDTIVGSSKTQLVTSTTNQITTNNQQIKNNDTVKLVYPTTGQVLSTSGIVNVNNKQLQFTTNKNTGQLGNGIVSLSGSGGGGGGGGSVVTTQTSNVSTNSATAVGASTVTSNINKTSGTQSIVLQPLNVSTNSVVVSGGQTITTNINKTQQQQQPSATQTIVLNKSNIQAGMVSVPMSVPVSVAGNTANATLQGRPIGVATSSGGGGGGGGGGGQTIVPGNLQIVNVNQVRPSTPVGNHQTGRQVPSRVILSPQILTRPGGPGITLHGLQSGAQGHLIVKTENGQFQLLRVGPPQTPGTPGNNAVTPNSISGNAVVGQNPGTTTTFRLASVPAAAVSRMNTQFTGPPLTTIRKPIQAVAPIVATTTVTPATATAPAPMTVTPPTPTTQATAPQPPPPSQTPAQNQSPAQRQTTTENTKEKCRKFLANLLELSSREPRSVERNVRTLIQELIDTQVEPEEFCDRLEKLLNASPQPCLIGFLKKSLPLLRQSLVTGELVIDGIKPPPPNVVFSIATTPSTVQQNQVRTTMAVPQASPYVVASAQVPTRVMPPPPTVPSTVTAVPTIQTTPRPQQVHQRLIRPTNVRSAPFAVRATNSTTITRPPAQPIAQKITTITATPTTTSTPVIKTITTTTAIQGKIVNTPTTIHKTIVPSTILPKPTAKEKEKKTFSSAGYTGDDDINDVAAMGGVNLAEESQRILGSTEFVGTQIRSCKDEIFLHVSPLQQKIKQIVSSHGLEEPNQEVAALISHATQERLKNLVEKLAVIAGHRMEIIRNDSMYEITQDVKGQLRFLEDIDKVERKRHEEQEREILMKAAKSRSKNEDPEQLKLKQMAKERQRVEQEEARQKDANSTALQAIGTRKKQKLDDGNGSSTGTGTNFQSNANVNRKITRPRVKRVNFRDLLFLLEQEKDTSRSTMLYKAFLK
ncbi:transcription initiation factor TFIID subunit 4 isoform X2 [Aphidius gifuensis]|uniref:transcription initiation factor TFIID subunit 4 isoform X2 n=1 Tax=Aphidius gifuensis TaxID=684658 RepID=UPI001CDC0976|nr:transcription initiation factor TFIID subunit 4 isoform X2 [Aphidius gifuensis]